MKTYGITINSSLVNNDGNYEVGVNVENSDGFKTSCSAEGNSMYDVISEIYNNILDELENFSTKDEDENKETVEDLHKKIEELERELNFQKEEVQYYKDLTVDLELDNKILQKRLNKTIDNEVDKEKSKKNLYKEINDAKSLKDLFSIINKYN